MFHNKENNSTIILNCDGNVNEKDSSQIKDKGPSGDYFLKYEGGSYGIYSFNNPDTRIIHLKNILGTGLRKLFYKDGKVYVFDLKTKDGPITGFIYKENSNKFELIEEFIVPTRKRSSYSHSLYAVLDLSPWDDEILLKDGKDVPFRSKLYTFNMKTHKTKDVGKATLFQGYLRCNIYEYFIKMQNNGVNRGAGK
jgi:hypothetical protein